MNYPSEYPLYTEPEPFYHKKGRERDLAEAKLYYNWFITHYEDRIPILLDFFTEELTNRTANDILRISNRVVECLQEPWCTYVPSRVMVAKFGNLEEEVPVQRLLTPSGKSLAIDMGLLVAHLILKLGKTNINWKLITKPKSYAYYHCPILTCIRL